MRARIRPLTVRADGRGTADCTVVKVGGGLLQYEGCFAHVMAALHSAHEAGASLLVLGGGGPFADAVRRADACHALGADAAHWMAIEAMDAMAQWIVSQLPHAVLVTSPYLAGAALDSGYLPVMAPAAWLRDTDTLPHSWDVTSDAIAAYLAGAVDAARLVLLKPHAGLATELTDRAFSSVLPHALPVDCFDARRADLAACLA